MFGDVADKIVKSHVTITSWVILAQQPLSATEFNQ